MTPIRVVALIEAVTVTGPAKNLIQFCRLARAAEAGRQPVDISLATFYRGASDSQVGTVHNQFIDAVREAGIPIDLIPERYRFDSKVVRHLRQIIARRDPHILQTHGIKSHFLTRAFGLSRGRKWIAFHHGYTAEDLKMRLYNQLNRWSFRGAQRVITVCGPFADVLVKHGISRDKITVLPNSIESPIRCSPETIAGLRARLGILRSEKMILCIGRLSSEKRQIDLIRAAALLRRDHPGVAFRLVLVGDGLEKENLVSEVHASGLDGRVIFAGHQSNVKPYYASADLFVLSSMTEGSPNVILESMAAGLPIVATAVGGVPETVQHEYSALLAPPADPAALSSAMARALLDPELAGRLAANASVEIERYSPDAYRVALTRIYQDLVAPG